jgi:tripartite-type tricarboxylate transporter receptor subunit TctC
MYAARRLAFVLALACAAPVHAQDPAADFPNRPLRQIVPFAPGGGVDIVTRIVAAKWSEVLGQPIAVENRAGAGGNLGATCRHCGSGGYTLFPADRVHGVSPAGKAALRPHPLRVVL